MPAFPGKIARRAPYGRHGRGDLRGFAGKIEKNRQKGVDKPRFCRYTKDKTYPEQPETGKGVRSYGYLPSY